jgi:hypothetical protein
MALYGEDDLAADGVIDLGDPVLRTDACREWKMFRIQLKLEILLIFTMKSHQYLKYGTRALRT